MEGMCGTYIELGAQTLLERLEWREGCCVVPFQCSHFLRNAAPATDLFINHRAVF